MCRGHVAVGAQPSSRTGDTTHSGAAALGDHTSTKHPRRGWGARLARIGAGTLPRGARRHERWLRSRAAKLGPRGGKGAHLGPAHPPRPSASAQGERHSPRRVPALPPLRPRGSSASSLQAHEHPRGRTDGATSPPQLGKLRKAKPEAAVAAGLPTWTGHSRAAPPLQNR